MKQAAIYARVSTSQQMEEGSGLESQVATLMRLAAEKGYSVTPEFVFREDWSGEDLERPQLDRLRTVAKQELICAIFVYSNDRLSRDPLHFLLLVDEWEKQGMQIFFAQEPLDTSEEGKLIAYVRGYASKLEAIRIRDRARRGLRARAERGLIVGGYNLYGYRYIHGKGPGQGRRVVNEREAEIVRKVFRWVVEEQMTARAIAIRLQEEGTPAPKGGRLWGTSTIWRILHRRDYTGSTHVFRTKGVEPSYRRRDPKKMRRKKTARKTRPREKWVYLPGVTPPVISEELFEAAQHQLRQNAVNSPRNRKHQYLLSGRIRCACGWAMRGQPMPPHYLYYVCRHRGREFGPERCRSKAIRAREVESLVWGEVKRALLQPEVIWGVVQARNRVDRAEMVENELKEAKGEIERLEKQERNLIYLYRVGEYDEKLLQAETKTLKEAQRRAADRHRELERRMTAISSAVERRESIEAYCEWASRNLEGLDFDQKRRVLEALDIRAIVDGRNVLIQGSLPVGSPPSYSGLPISKSRCESDHRGCER